MKFSMVLLLSSILVFCGLAFSQTDKAVELGSIGLVGESVNAGPECSDGEIHDDGTVENGYGWNPTVVTDGGFVELFTPAAYPFIYSQVC
ncbi:MAG: hypothetical protein L6Q94_23775, partial [Calditrichia bacterium]|nr:hypothetical protein [Calditrichia bacterium]